MLKHVLVELTSILQLSWPLITAGVTTNVGTALGGECWDQLLDQVWDDFEHCSPFLFYSTQSKSRCVLVCLLTNATLGEFWLTATASVKTQRLGSTCQETTPCAARLLPKEAPPENTLPYSFENSARPNAQPAPLLTR